MKNYHYNRAIGNIRLLISILLVLFIMSCGNNERQANNQKEIKSGTIDADSVKSLSRNIVFFGNSLTAGYGVEPSEAFPALIQKKIDSLQFPYKVINAGVSGETSAGGNERVDWILRQPVDIFVLELGGNDGLRGIAISETRKNLQSIIDKVKNRYPEARLIMAGMQMPPNMGKTYTEAFRSLFPELAEKNNMALIPFLLEGVGGEPSLNLPDGIHPNPEGQKIVAENVWEVIKNELQPL